MSTKDYRIIYNKNRLKICPSYEVLITIFHEMRHIYQRCCVDFYERLNFDEPIERIKQREYEFSNYYLSDEEDIKYLEQDCEIDDIAFTY